MMSINYSIVEYRGSRQGYSCGYCGLKNTKCSTGMWAHSLTVEDYQRLIDRGWRRSGKYVYKPTMDKTCCPQYAIRCPVAEFRMSKSHKKVIKRNNKFFNTGVGPSKQQLQVDEDNEMTGASVSEHLDEAAALQQAIIKPPQCDIEQPTAISHSEDTQCQKPSSSSASSVMQSPEANSASGESASTRPSEPSKCIKKQPKPGKGPDPTKPKCIKAKLQRLQRKIQKQSDLETSNKKVQNSEPKPLEVLLNEIRSDATHKLEIRLVRSWPRSAEFDSTFVESHKLWRCYQQSIHKEAAEECDEKSFLDFLVTSPLEPVYDDHGKHDGFGSFHQQYILDGKIIAVGVLDILPHCVSSVYLYYDPDYFFLSPGTYSALREIAFVKHLHSLVPSIEYYYMGYYIHSCPKMKYKGQYNPSYLLCPETYIWFPIEKCAPKLDVNKYSRFDDTDKVDEDGEGDIREVLCLHMRQVMPYFIYMNLNKKLTDLDEVREYLKLVGFTCAKRMLLYRPPAVRASDDDDDDDDDD